MESVILGEYTFRWDGERLTITTLSEQGTINAPGALALLDMLYQQRESIFTAAHPLPGWAQGEPQLGHTTVEAVPPRLLKPAKAAYQVEGENG